MEMLILSGAFMRTILLSSTILFALSGAAFAADAVAFEPAPAAPPAGFVWTGGYVGLHGGYAWTNGKVNVDSDPTVDVDGLNGGLLGVHAGYNWQFNDHFVGGVEFDVEHAWTKKDVEFFNNLSARGGTDWQGSARLRAGYAMDRTMVFVTGGVAFANATVEMPDFNYDESRTFVGWTVGAGIEHAITDNWVASLEYRYNDFGSKSFPQGVKVDLDQHTVRAGISYKF
jgi:outer membrane immunogenic protein